jgi:hypothetical protein
MVSHGYRQNANVCARRVPRMDDPLVSYSLAFIHRLAFALLQATLKDLWLCGGFAITTSRNADDQEWQDGEQK